MPPRSMKFSLAALLLIPLAYVAERLDARPAVVFVIGAAAIMPLAHWIRTSTEQLAARAGRAIGGLLNVTFGNVAELTLALFVLAAGNASVVKAQITGSMIGNSLLGLGLAIVWGTWNRERLPFKRERAGLLSSLLILATIALLLPAMLDYTERGLYATPDPASVDEHLSLGVSIVLLVMYVANLWYTMITHRDIFAFDVQEDPEAAWPLWQSLTVLFAATVGTAWMAELVSDALETTAATWNVSTFFLGVIVLAVIGNASEYFSAVHFARKGEMGLVMTLTVGSTIQIALVVAPVLVIASWLMGRPMDLVFDNPLELIAIAGVAFAVNAIAQDGETTWFEGVLLLAVYSLLGLAFFFATPALR